MPTSDLRVVSTDETVPPVLDADPPAVLPTDPPRATRTPDAPRPSVPIGVPIEERFRLPAHRNKVERVVDHTHGLVDDITEWVELRVKLVKSEIEALIDSRVGAMRGLLVFGVTAALTGLYALVTLAVIIGALTGGRYWIGFLVVNLILVAVTLFVKREFAPGKMRIERSKATGTLKVSHDETPAQREAKEKGQPVPNAGEKTSSDPVT